MIDNKMMGNNKFWLWILSFFVASALLLSSCHKEPIEEPEDNPPVNPTPGGNNDTAAVFLTTGTVIHNAVTDFDGNRYDAVVIGNQVWMAENLITTHYANGEEIPLTEGYDLSYFSSTEPYRYVPDAGTANVETYGYLYNWPAVMNGAFSSDANPSGVQGICPNGWHVPSDSEWKEFADTISSYPEYVVGDDIRYIDKAIASTTLWMSSTYLYSVGNDQSLNNATHFGLKPAGSLHGGSPGGCGLGYFALVWSCTEYKDNPEKAWHRYINNQSARAFHVDGKGSKAQGLSVRCLRDAGANE